MDETLLQDILTWEGAILLAFILSPIYRIAVGPTAMDRIVAVNMVGTKTAVLLVAAGSIFDRIDMFVDFALAYAMLNFIGSIAVARYFFRLRSFDPAATPDQTSSQPE